MSNTKNMSRGKRGAKNRRNNSKSEMISHPSTIQSYSIRHNTVLRFVATSAFDNLITFASLLDTLLIASSATVGYDIFHAVKVRAVELWAIAAVGTPTTVSVVYAGNVAGFVGDQVLHTDTSMGVQPAHVMARPQARSLAANFQLGVNDTAFSMTCPAGTVIDVHLSFIGTFRNAQAAQQALVGATTGATYLRGLDGLAISSTLLPPAITDDAI